jgi:hypothetical protein
MSEINPNNTQEENLINSQGGELTRDVPSANKPSFNPWDITEKPKGTNEVNVLPKLPGRNRVHFHRGRNETAASLPGLRKLERQVARIMRENTDISEEAVITTIEDEYRKSKPPRGQRFHSTTIRRLVQENKTRQE